MQTGKLFVRDRNARAIFCIGFFAAQHPVKDVLSCTENRLIVHRIGDNGSLTVKVAVFHKEILRVAVTFNNVFIDVPEFDRSRRSGQRCFMKAHEFHKLFIREGIGIKADAGNANLHFAGKVIVNFGDDFLLDPLVCFLNIGSRVKYRELHDVDSLRKARVISRINATAKCRDSLTQFFHRRNVSGDILFYNGVPVFDDETFRKSYAAIVNKYGEMPIDTLKGGEIALLPEPIKIRSMISGNIGFKARLFRAITAWGSKKNGPVTNTLLSNNKANTEYFGRQQGNAIPITMQDEHKIYEAATDLLGSKHRFPVPATSQSLYSKNQIIWSDDMPTKLEDAVIDLCCCRSDKAKTISQANESGSETTIRILEKTKLYQGRITVLSDIEKNLVVNVWNLDMNNKGCSASSFTQMTLDELLGNFAKHYTDMEIDRSQTCRDADGTSRDFARAINIYNSLFAKNSDGSTSSFNNALWKQLSISIYSGTKYPEQVLSLALLRSCRLLQQNKKGKENRITASLAGITKAFLIRNYGENMTMGLNSNNTSPAYITGRIFAHMESAQRKIDPNNQTTYAKRFFERVMMNPAKTMPELHKSFLLLKNKAKANGMRGLYNSSDKKIMALIDMLDGNYPDHLSEKQKGEYLVGYYQQRSANIKDAEEKKNRKAAKIETNNTDTATTVATQKEK